MLAYMEHDYYEVEGTEVTSEEFYKYTEALRNMEKTKDIDFEEELVEKKLVGWFDGGRIISFGESWHRTNINGNDYLVRLFMKEYGFVIKKQNWWMVV